MNRQIKFRAWFKDKKEMREVAMLRWEYGRMTRVAGYNLDTNHNGWTDYDPESGELELMQFTGLLDKNGKEIFEGDVVNDEVENMVVEFRDAKWKPFDDFNMEYGPYSKECEVIGNIYENPSLLSRA